MNKVLHRKISHDFIRFLFVSIDIHDKKEYNIILEI